MKVYGLVCTSVADTHEGYDQLICVVFSLVLLEVTQWLPFKVLLWMFVSIDIMVKCLIKSSVT
jgi:hypothetical protein